MDDTLPFEDRAPKTSTPSEPRSTNHPTPTTAAGDANSGSMPIASAPAAQPSPIVSPAAAAQSLPAERQQAPSSTTPMRTQADPLSQLAPPTATMSPTPSTAGAQTILPASDISVETKDCEAQPEPGRYSLPYPGFGSGGRVESKTASRSDQEPKRGGEKAGFPAAQSRERQEFGDGSSQTAPLDPKLVPATVASDPTLIGWQYPKDSAEELKRIGAEIEALRKPSKPAMQVYANEHRIRDLASRGYQIKEVYDHLVRKKRIDPDEVSYKQFAGQVKIKKLRDSTA